MTRDPLLPVRLVDGVWTTEGAGSAADATEPQPGIMAPMTWPTPAEPDLMIPWMPWGYDKTEPRQWAKPGAEEGTVEIGGQTFRAVMTWKPKETT